MVNQKQRLRTAIAALTASVFSLCVCAGVAAAHHEPDHPGGPPSAGQPSPPSQANTPPGTPGNSGNSPEGSGGGPGNSGSAPGNPNPGAGSPAGSRGTGSPGNSGGNPGNSPGTSGNPGGAPRNSGGSPGNSGSAPGRSGGNPGNSGGSGNNGVGGGAGGGRENNRGNGGASPASGNNGVGGGVGGGRQNNRGNGGGSGNAGGGPTAPNGNGPAPKIGLCHATGSQTNPYVFISVSANAWNGHSRHGDLPASSAADCPGGAPDGPGKPGKVTICHATGSETNPYVLISISENGLKGHSRHGDFFASSEADCTEGSPIPRELREQPGGGPGRSSRGGVAGELAEGGSDAELVAAGLDAETQDQGEDRSAIETLAFTGWQVMKFLLLGMIVLGAGLLLRRGVEGPRS